MLSCPLAVNIYAIDQYCAIIDVAEIRMQREITITFLCYCNIFDIFLKYNHFQTHTTQLHYENLFLFGLSSHLSIKTWMTKLYILCILRKNINYAIKNLSCEFEMSIMHFCEVYGYTINKKKVSFGAPRWYRNLVWLTD